MAYTIEYKPAALRDLNALERRVRIRIQRAIEALAENPFPPKVKKMAGKPDRWRIRVSEYRVVYEVHNDRLVILVVAVGHRREIYR